MSSLTSSPRGEAPLCASPARSVRRIVFALIGGALLGVLVYQLWPLAGARPTDSATTRTPASGAARTVATPPTPTQAGRQASPAERDAEMTARWQRWLGKSTVPELVIVGMGPWLQGASEDELVAALQALQSIHGVSPEMHASLCRALLGELVDRDGEVAIEVARGLGLAGERGTDLEEAVYAAWAATDPDAALAHVLPRLDGDAEDAPDMLTGILGQIARSDPARAAALAKDYVRSDNWNVRGVGLGYRQAQFVARFQGVADVEGAFRAAAEEAVSPAEAEAWHGEVLAWAEKAKDRELMARALGKVTNVENVWLMREAVAALTNSHPQVVRAFLERLEDDPKKRGGDVIRYAVSRATPPQQAAMVDWLLSRPPTEHRNNLLEWTAVMLATTDIPQALRAVEGLGAGVKKTELQHAYGFRWLAADPERARAQLPAEVLANYDKLVTATEGGALDVIPGAKARVVFDFSEAWPDMRRAR